MAGKSERVRERPFLVNLSLSLAGASECEAAVTVICCASHLISSPAHHVRLVSFTTTTYNAIFTTLHLPRAY